MSRETIRKGIKAYSHEQKVILRLLSKKGQFTEREFDKWFRGRDTRRPRLFMHGISGDTFILGMGQNGGNAWAKYLDLMQHMMALGLVDAVTENGLVVYKKVNHGTR